MHLETKRWMAYKDVGLAAGRQQQHRLSRSCQQRLTAYHLLPQKSLSNIIHIIRDAAVLMKWVRPAAATFARLPDVCSSSCGYGRPDSQRSHECHDAQIRVRKCGPSDYMTPSQIVCLAIQGHVFASCNSSTLETWFFSHLSSQRLCQLRLHWTLWHPLPHTRRLGREQRAN